MKSKQTKNKPKNLLEKLAPAYAVVAALMFGGALLSNVDNLKEQQPLDILPWFVGGLLLAVSIFIWVANKQLEEGASTDTLVAQDLRLARLILGGLLLIPVCLVVAGFNLHQAIGNYYAVHGYNDMLYVRKGLIPSVGQLYLATICISIGMGTYFLILRQTPLISVKSLFKLLLTVVIAIPLVVIIWSLEFSRHYQF